MLDVLIGMAALIGLGAFWRWWQPGGLDGDRTRGFMTAIVYYYLLPALVLQVLWGGELGLDSIRIAIVSAACVLLGMSLGWIAGRLLRAPATVIGAMILAAGYPNATYMGLPVLDAILGAEGRSIAIQFDYFAATPLLLTMGALLAQQFGQGASGEAAWRRLVRVPPLIAAVTAVGLNLLAVSLPSWLDHVLGLLAAGVVPLMLLALGMSLSLSAITARTAIRAAPVIVIQLALMPLFALLLTDALGLTGAERIGTVLEAAMPAMVFGIIFCDRYGLDAKFYSMTVTISTVLSLATLPLWLTLLQG
jgi:malate permease and related proteins